MPKAETAAEIPLAMDRSVEEALKRLRNADKAFLETNLRVKMQDGEKTGPTRLAFLRTTMLNHLYHHRGQLSLYLRMIGAPVPAVFGPSGDDMHFDFR